MLDRLRLFLNRPLSDADRPRLFAVAVAIIAGAAAILALLDEAGPSAAPARPAAEASTPAPTPSRSRPIRRRTRRRPPRRATRRPPSGPRARRSPPPGAPPAASWPAISRTPTGAARCGGSAPPHPRCARAWPASAPASPPRERRRRPRVELLQSDGVSARRGAITATVRDGRRRYPVRLELERTPAGWVVVDAGG